MEVRICQGQPSAVSEGTEASKPPGAPLPLCLVPDGMSMVLPVPRVSLPRGSSCFSSECL